MSDFFPSLQLFLLLNMGRFVIAMVEDDLEYLLLWCVRSWFQLLSTLFFRGCAISTRWAANKKRQLSHSLHTRLHKKSIIFNWIFFFFSLPLFPQIALSVTFVSLFSSSIRTRLNYAMTRVHNSWIGAAVRLMLISVCLIDIQPKVSTESFFSLPTCKICTIHTIGNSCQPCWGMNFHNAVRVQTFQSFNQNAPHSNLLDSRLSRSHRIRLHSLSLALTEKDGEKIVHWSVFFQSQFSVCNWTFHLWTSTRTRQAWA